MERAITQIKSNGIILQISFISNINSTWIGSTYISELIYNSLWFPSGFPWVLLLSVTVMLLNQGPPMIKLKSSLQNVYGRHYELVTLTKYVSQSRHSWLIIGFLRRVPRFRTGTVYLFPELVSSSPFSGARVAQSLVL